MDLLVLGGTLFLGRHVVEAALARGHRVTLFNRGTRDVPWAGVETRIGDRDGGLEALSGGRWDAVVDTCGYVPRLTGVSARFLADAVDRYVYVSSASVYADLDVAGLDESGRTLTLDDPASEDVPAHYGALKASCERAVEDAMPDRALHVRAGLIVGPFDATGRFAYWVRRMAEGGEVLAPGDPDRPVQLIHARDLADWMVAMAEAGTTGTFNATGPALPLTMRALLESCADGREVALTWVDDAFLAARDVAPFSDLPFWLPNESAGLLALDVSKAVAAGLRCRPLVDTVRDTARWLDSDPGRAPTRLASGVATRAGLAPDRERELLAAWKALSSK